MIDMDDIMPLIIGILAAVVLFFGFTIALKKTIPADTGHITTEHDKILMKQRWRMDDVRQRQKQLLRDQKQKIRDMRRR